MAMNVDDLPITQSVISSMKPLMPMCRRKYRTKFTRFPGSQKFYPALFEAVPKECEENL